MDSCSKRPIPIPENHFLSDDPFAVYNHVELLRLFDDGSAEGELAIHPDSLNPYGIVHGGCLTTLADTVGGWAVYAATGRTGVTASYTLNFLRPAGRENKRIFCRAHPERIGNHLCVYHVTISGEDGAALATGLFTFSLVKSPSKVGASPASDRG